MFTENQYQRVSPRKSGKRVLLWVWENAATHSWNALSFKCTTSFKWIDWFGVKYNALMVNVCTQDGSTQYTEAKKNKCTVT